MGLALAVAGCGEKPTEGSARGAAESRTPAERTSVSPLTGGPHTRFAINVEAADRPVGVIDGVRHRYYVHAEADAPAARCVNERDSWLTSGGSTVAYIQSLGGKGGPEGFCAGTFTGELRYAIAYACPDEGVCDPPDDAPHEDRVVSRFKFEVLRRAP